MDKVEEFATPIKRVLQAHPLYTAIALSLGYSVYRWNATRVRPLNRSSSAGRAR